jgi:Kef-type K+ transport system membrane component KefB
MTASPVFVLLLQLLVILAAGRAMGLVFRRFGQTAVIGEMLAGVLLGPSVLGRSLPQVEALVFPPSSMPALHLISQLGIILFMFVVGMELDFDGLRRRARATVVISNTGIVVPFCLGAALASRLHAGYAPAGVRLSTFALFTGVAMSITAFPVLARIIAERGLTGTALGGTAIGCAAMADVTAWCLLAVVLAVGRGSGVSAPFVAAACAAILVWVVLTWIRPRATRLFGTTSAIVAPPTVLSLVLVAMFVAALFTELIGIHALFGAFLAGIAVGGAADLRDPVRRAIEPLSAAVLVPVFFAYSGLRTEIGLVQGWTGWLVCLAIVATAVAGKLGGTAASARWTGMPWRESLALGALMNTRGLMELIVLNVGYDLGILSPALYTMMVVMALATTCMTGPLLAVLGPSERATEVRRPTSRRRTRTRGAPPSAAR